MYKLSGIILLLISLVSADTWDKQNIYKYDYKKLCKEAIKEAHECNCSSKKEEDKAKAKVITSCMALANCAGCYKGDK